MTVALGHPLGEQNPAYRPSLALFSCFEALSLASSIPAGADGHLASVGEMDLHFRLEQVEAVRGALG